MATPFNPPGVIPGLTGPVIKRPSPQSPLPAPTTPGGYQTYKFTPPPGQLLKFAPGKGYYAALAPDPPLGAYQSPGALYGGDLSDPKPGPFPGFMTPQQMFDQAKKMADMSFGPVLQEAYRQQRQLHESNMAQLAGIQAAYQAIGIDPKSAIGVASYNKAVAEAQASESDFAGKLVDLVAQEGQAQAGYLSDLQKNQQGLYSDYQSQHKPIIHWGKDGSVLALDPATGQIQVLQKGTGGGAGKVDLTLSKQLGVYVDGNGIPLPNLAGQTPPAAPTKDPKVDVQLSTKLHKWVDSSGTPIPSLAGRIPPQTVAKEPNSQSYTTRSGKTVIFHPGTGKFTDPVTKQEVDPNAGAPPVNQKAVSSAWSYIRQAKGGWMFQGHLATTAQIQAVLKSFNAARGFNGQPQRDADGKIVVKNGKIVRNPPPVTIVDLPNLSRDQLQHLGIGRLTPQQIYLNAIEKYNLPARKVWQLVRRAYPKWGGGYFGGPKVETAAETAAVDVSRWVRTPAGVDRPGMPTHPGILAFAARVAQIWGSPLTVGTGTNHNQYVKGEGNTQSAHWTGWAVDIPMSGAQLTKLGQDALIAAGMPETQARKITHYDGGDYNGYNILFNTNVGGNHYNHLHIGLKPSRQRDPVQTQTISTTRTQPGKIDTFLSHHGSPLAGFGSVFVKAGAMYGVDPALLVAIAGAESSFGRINSGSHNPFGWGPGIHFSTFPAAIYAVAKGLRDLYIKKGLTTIEAIGRKWAPVGAGNDPTNLNSNWTGNVSRYYRELTGTVI